MADSTVVASAILIGLILVSAMLGVLYGFRRRVKAGWVSLILEEDGYPSLSRLQFLLRTGIAVFAFVTVSFIRILSGVTFSTILPTNILTLLGISAASPVAGTFLSAAKYREERKAFAAAMATAQATHTEFPNDMIQPLHTMLEENKIFNVTRFQMFAWTLVAITIFSISLIALLSNIPQDLSKLDIPDVNTTLVDLMGISQGTYVLGKGASA